ncbi:Spy/CpxP family protein refolding chaperone [Anthocerotibacter panamensis]|uniref:Spy/CpxP family protein refolding chaperone n=1 Tax=Anthocerotibacter panamensis TaxID=2857077 RepID=UPI001C403B1F|nr:periplasmic heavy metal sensor [Anthocerotibacter panamensis]
MSVFKYLTPLVLLTLACPVLGQPLPPDRPRAPRLDFKGLNLSPSQMNQIQTIQQEDRIRIKELRRQVEQAQGDFRDAMVTDPDTQVLRQYDQLQQLQNQIGRRRVENFLRLRNVLTPQQRRQLRGRLDRQDEQPRNRFDR